MKVLCLSALPPKADMCGANEHVCFGPIADVALFNRRSAIYVESRESCGHATASALRSATVANVILSEDARRRRVSNQLLTI
jgi:hypothetical protein